MAQSLASWTFCLTVTAAIVGIAGAIARGQDGAARVQPDAPHGARSLVGHAGPLYTVAFSPDGLRVATGEYDGTVRVYDAANGRVAWTVADPQKAPALAIAFSPDGSRMVVGGVERWAVLDRGNGTSAHWEGGKVKVWDAANGREVRSISGFPIAVEAVRFLGPDGTRIITIDRDYRLSLRATDSGEEVLALDGLAAHGQGLGGPMIVTAFSADGQRIVIQSNAEEEYRGEHTLRLKSWELTDRRARNLDLPQTLGSISGPVALRPDGARLIVAYQTFTTSLPIGGGGRADRWLSERDAATGASIAGFEAPPRIQLVTELLAFSPDGDLIVSTGSEDGNGNDRTLMIWDSRTGRRLQLIKETHGQVRAVAFLPGRVRAASGGFESPDERDKTTGRLKVEPLTIWEFDLARRPG